MTATFKVFGIPELTTAIANNLIQHDLAACCLVNHAWYNNFNPHLWHSITLQLNDPLPKFVTPEGQAGLLRNGHYIRVLRTTHLGLLEPFVKYGTICTNLVCIDAQAEKTTTTTISGGAIDNGARSEALLATGRRGLSLEEGQRQVEGGGSRTFSENGLEHLEKILISILKRNPHLEFLVVPHHSLWNENFLRCVEECLPELKEFYSPKDLSRRGIDWTRFELSGPPTSAEGDDRFVPVVSGCIRSTRSTAILDPLLEDYPRLVKLRQGIAEKITQETLERIRSAHKDLTCLAIDCNYTDLVAQVLMAAPALTSIVCNVYGYDGGSINQSIIPALLKHAATLEHLNTEGRDFDNDVIRAVLFSCPRLKTLKTMEPVGDYGPVDEVEIDAQRAFESPWACEELEVLECKIIGVPRPDVIVNSVYDASVLALLPPNTSTATTIPSSLSPEVSEQIIQVAQEQSHALQRRILKQLGRLKHLRVLRLGHDPYSGGYIELEIRGVEDDDVIRVTEYFQCRCLDFSLESGLEELAELKELEWFDVKQMVHRIGLREAGWMLDHWPKFNKVHGWEYGYQL